MANHFTPAQRKSKKSPRNWQIVVRFTEQERKSIDERRAKLSYSSYVRQAVLNRKAPSQIPAVNRKTYNLLVKVSANLNQLTRAVNTLSKQGRSIAGLNTEVLLDLQQSIAQVNTDLIGSNSTDLSDEVDEAEESEGAEVDL